MALLVAKTKYCCKGQNAIMIVPLWPMNIRGKKHFTALYQCKCCKEHSLRGDNQEKQWNTYVKILNKKEAQEYINRKQRKKK